MQEDVIAAALCLLVVIAIRQTSAEYDDLCVRFADGVKFREPGNCEAYVTCSGGVGTVTTCPDGQLYDKDNSKCVAKLTDTYCNELCKSKSDIFIQDASNCDGYYYCDGGKAIKGTCPSGFNFQQSTQMCVFPSTYKCYGVSDFCGILPNSVPFSDPDNCNKYYQCTKGALKSTSCSSGLYYDVASGSCINKYSVECNSHPIPSNVCGKDSKPVYDKFVSDGVTCRGYYYCAYKGAKISDKNPAWKQCDQGYFFDADKQMCRDPTEVACSYDRCDGRGDSLVISGDYGCQYYYQCENGVQKEKKKCPTEMFFDEHRQACTHEEVFYSVCDF